MNTTNHSEAFNRYSDAFFSNRTCSSDKWEHYFEIYDHLFSKWYGKPITYVEIGVQNGGSLEIARKLFNAGATIVGVDIDPSCKSLETRGVADHIVIGSQTNLECLQEIVNVAGQMDIIVDDGSHMQDDMIITFLNLFHYLKEGGVYVIEDTHTNYSTEHQRSFYGIGLYDYFKGLTERLNLDFMDPQARQSRFKMPREQRPSVDKFSDVCNQIFSIEFFNSVIAIRKKTQLEPFRIRK